MFIHIWMHWFWITAAYLKGFLLLTISLSCIPHPLCAEAGLLANDTLPLHPLANDSSQPPAPSLPPDPPTTTSPPPSPLLPPSDLPDTHGGSLDPFQHPLKKFSKHSHPKYPKGPKPKPPDDPDAPRPTDQPLSTNASTPHPDRHDSLPPPATSDAPPTDPPVPPDPPDPPDPTTTPPAPAPAPQHPPDHHTDLEILNNDTLVIESKLDDSGAYTTVEPFLVRNRVAAATSAHSHDADHSDLNAGSITGITLGALVVFSLFGAVSFVLYRRRYLNKPEVLHDKCSNLDSSGYIDEASLRENSEEMYSLDNDSFLNSLEAMTIQNYWTESVKHTKL